jgi:hypothetical protein
VLEQEVDDGPGLRVVVRAESELREQ